MQKKIRAWTFTINNPTSDDLGGCLEAYDTLAKYMILGFEIGGKKKTFHIQGYIYFNNAQYQSTVKALLPRAKLFHSKGNPEQNRIYCTKGFDGDLESTGVFEEFGVLPVKGHASWDKICDAMIDPKSAPHLYMQYRKAFLDITINQESVIKDRILYKAPAYARYSIMRHLQINELTFSLSDTYQSENVCIIDLTSPYATFDQIYEDWAAGFPPKVKYGYQYIRFDPDVCIFLYDDRTYDKKIKSLQLYSIENAASEKESETRKETDEDAGSSS